MDKIKFKEICEKFINSKIENNGIGTLKEKTLHIILKHYFEPAEICHEVKVASFVADIVSEKGIIEIQTRSFDKLRKKLNQFLEATKVTVVYPIASTKYLVWVNEETGEITKRRKSPKSGRIFDASYELYKIKNLLTHPNLRFCFVFVDLEEHRLLNGWSRDKKKGSTRYDRIPLELVDEVYINNLNDFLKFLPDELGSQFTSKSYAEIAKINRKTAQTALNILNYIGVVKRTGKQRNAWIYEKQV